MASNNLPTRTNTSATDDAIPDEDTSEVGLRLMQAQIQDPVLI